MNQTYSLRTGAVSCLAVLTAALACTSHQAIAVSHGAQARPPQTLALPSASASTPRPGLLASPAIATPPQRGYDNPPSSPFGPSLPVVLGPFAKQGSWTVLCEATPTNQKTATLYLPSGGAVAVNAWLSASADDRFVAFARGPQVTVIDTTSGRNFDLTQRGFAGPLSPETGEPHRLRFHPSKPALAFVAERDHAQALILLDLEQDTERIVRPLSAGIEQIRWDASGSALYLEESSSFRQRLDAIAPSNPEAVVRWPCRGEAEPRFFVGSPRQRRITTTVVDAEEGQSRPQVGQQFITPNGTFLLSEDGHLTLLKGKQSTPLLPGSCQAVALGSHPDSSSLLIGCSDKGKMRIWLVSPGIELDLGIDVPVAFDLSQRIISPRILPIYSGSKTYLIDFAQKRAIAVTDRDQLLAQSEKNVLLRRGKEVVRRCLDTGTETSVLQVLPTGVRLLFAKGWVYAEPYLIRAEDGAAAQVDDPQAVLAVSGQGCLLYQSRSNKPWGYAEGPLHWSCPKR